jgi:hypothetical protein
VVEASGEVPEAEAERLAVVERIFLGAPEPAGAGGKVRRLRAPGSAAA